MNEDFQLIAEQSLRSLYLQMVDYYTESINKGSQLSQNLLNYFNLNNQTGNNSTPELSKSESEIEKFINSELIQLNPITNQIVEFETNDSTIKWLISRYNFFGIPTPPDGFLKIDDGVKSWWKTKSKLKNGFFTFVEVFNFNPVGNKATIGDKTFSFDEEQLIVKTGAGSLGAYLQDKIKDAYIEYAKQNAFNEIISKNQLSEKYMFALDKNSNSFHIEADANGQTSKLYIRYFFNEFGQKLDLNVIEIQGVDKLQPIPGGIRKNYIVRNLFSGISGYEKYYKKRENKSEKTDKNIEDLKKVKKSIDISIEAQDITLNSRIAFIFNNDYEFLSFLDGENKNINNNELYLFLKTNKELNKIIASLNAINCEFGTSDTTTQTTDVGDAPSDYNHFVSSDAPYNNPTQEEKAINYKAKRSELKFIGDVALRTAFDEIRKTPAGAAVADIYDTFLNKVDVFELARMFASSLAPNMTLPDLRRTYFKVFINSLDITELVDCVVLNAGRPAESKSTTYPEQEYDENGKPIEATGPAQTVVFQSSINFERDLKTLLYGRFAFFYNMAASFDSDTFDFGNLPTTSNEFQAVNEAAAALENAKTTPVDAPDAPSPEQIVELEEAYLQTLSALDGFLDKNFMYILMVPESQQEKIYSTIVSNDPQYEYKPAFINNGLIEARDTPGFSPENFITTLFKNLINQYADQTEYFLSFYDNIAKKNKKLKNSSEVEKDIKSGSSSVGDVAKTSKNTLPEPINFGWYDGFIPTFDLNATFSSLISKAYDDAMKDVLNPIVDSNKAALDKMANGDPEKYNRADPGTKNEYTSNDLTANVINGVANNIFSSPVEIYLKIQSDILKNNTISEIECLFSKIFSEVPIQTQLRFLTDSINPEDTDFSIMQEMFSTCGLDSDYTSIRNFFSWYNGLLNESGGINEILQKIEAANIASVLNTDICDNNSEYINSLPFVQEIAQQLAANESGAAAQAMENVLSLLNLEARKNSAPKLYNNCSNDPNKKPVFEDFYRPHLQYNFNNQIKDLLKGINSVFNKDISKFKSIILKQNNNDPVTALGGPENLIDFLNKSNTLITQNKTSNPDVDPTPYKLQQNSVENVIMSLFDKYNFILDEDSSIISNADGLTIYRDVLLGGVISEIVINTANTTVDYLGLSIEAGFSYIVVRENNKILYSDLISSSAVDLIALYQSFLNAENPLSFSDDKNKNQLIFTDYPDLKELSEEVLHEKFYSQQLLSLLYSGYPSIKSLESIVYENSAETPIPPKGGAPLSAITDPDLEQGHKTLLEGIVNATLLRFIKQTPVFKTKEFNNVPLKDLEAAVLDVENKNYQDNGLLISDKIQESYESLRKRYQCFISPTSTPDPHQVSKLKSIYESLFNVLIMENFLVQFFSLGQEQLGLIDDDLLKQRILNGIDSSFNTTVNQIDNLQVDYRSDIDLIYHYEILDRKSKEHQNLIDPPEWNYPNTEEGTNQKIIFLAEKYYDNIYSRLMSRISVSFGDEFSFNAEQNSSNIFNKAPNGSTIFKMYDEVEYLPTGGPIPILYGLSKGIIFQEYVDIRQNGSIFKQLIDGELQFGFNPPPPYNQGNYLELGNAEPGFFVPGYDAFDLADGEAYNNNTYQQFEAVLQAYLPYWNAGPYAGSSKPFDDNQSYLGGRINKFVGANNDGIDESKVPGYSQLFFTKAVKDIEVNIVSAVPYREFDIDSSNNYTPRFELDDPTDWRKDFYRTQGKISRGDFNEFYYNNLYDPSTTKYTSVDYTYFFKNNGPKTYYKKVSAGTRMCLVLDYKFELGDSDLTALVTRYMQTLREPQGGKKSVEAREIMKEKIGLYKNESGDSFLVIPLMERETDFLDDLYDDWLDDHDNFKWWFQILSYINGHSFEPQQAQIKEVFQNSYPFNGFTQILPALIEEIITEEYGEDLSNLFNATKEKILRSIFVTKAIINNDYDFELPTDGTRQSINSNLIYIPLVLSFIPVIIKLLATFTDPLWRTMWFNPGPQTAVGYLAKILDATD